MAATFGEETNRTDDRAALDSSARNDDDENEDGLTGCGATPICNPRHWSHRFAFLTLLCFLNFGSYFCYDNPGSLSAHITQDMDITTLQYELLYSLYSWPNVILSLVGGFLVDSWLGVRLGAIVFSFFILGGQIVFALGGLTKMFWLMAAGRFIFGLGGENLAVCQNAYAVAWFLGKELNFVFGLLLSTSRIGSSVNFATMNALYRWVAGTDKGDGGHIVLGTVLMIAVVTCLFSQYCAFHLGWMDRRAQRILHRGQAESGERVEWRDMFRLPLSMYLLSLLCIGYYCAIFPFVSVAELFFIHKYEMSVQNAGFVSSLIYLISAFASPVCGFLLDRTGRNLTWCIISSVMGVFGFGLMAFTWVNPLVPMCIIGVSYSLLASAFWPSVAYVVPEFRLGTAYGFIQSAQNLGLALFTMATGYIAHNAGYLVLMVFFIASICAGILAAVFLIVLDQTRHGGLMNMAAGPRNAQLAAMAAAEDEKRAAKAGAMPST